MNSSFKSKNILFFNYLQSIICVKNNCYYHVLMVLVLLYYASLRFKRFKNRKVIIKSLSDKTLGYLLDKYCHKFDDDYVDLSCCALGNLDHIAQDYSKNWINICSDYSKRGYKLQFLNFKCLEINTVYVSETNIYNIENLLDSSFFILPGADESPKFADEIKISLVANPHECPENLMDNLLKNYFSVPRYLRRNDIICARIKDYAPEFFYTLSLPQLSKIYFKVKSIKLKEKSTNRACYVARDKSTLIQEGLIHEYLPRQYQLLLEQSNTGDVADELEQCSMPNCPRFLDKYVETLEDCIYPFMRSNNWMNIRPVFLVEGARGAGKHRLLSCLAKRLGLNFFTADCTDIQTLSPSQTEAKLRIVLSNAEHYTPCILKLSNIETFGRNSEGKIDERITSNFTEQLNNLYCEEKTNYPLIVIATTESPDISAEISRNFIERIKIQYLNQDERANTIEWFSKIKKFKYSLDVPKIAAMCSDFVLNDLETLTLNAAKNSYKRFGNNKNFTIELCDYIKALDSMQEIFSNEIGAPKIPEVHWEDIGGLANLKHEIIRRIELPLLHNSGIKSSGLLFYGPPGTGKTLLAKAVATECKLHFLSVKGPELLNMYVGQSEKNIRDIFERAKSASPCIIFFDELDALAPNRGKSGDSGGVMDRVVSQLLAEMDGLGSSISTFIIGATNRPDLIDPALLRPGRFDKLLYIGIYSDSESQLSVLKAITRKFTLDDDSLLERVADKLPVNLTGADLQSVCANAWLNAAKRIIEKYESEFSGDEKSRENHEKPEGNVVVEIEDFIGAIEELVPSVTKDELDRYETLNRELSSKN